jgi:hypothetical protein
MSKVYKKSICFLNTGSFGDMSVKNKNFMLRSAGIFQMKSTGKRLGQKLIFPETGFFLEKQFSESTFLHISSDIKSKLNMIFNTPF